MGVCVCVCTLTELADEKSNTWRRKQKAFNPSVFGALRYTGLLSAWHLLNYSSRWVSVCLCLTC